MVTWIKQLLPRRAEVLTPQIFYMNGYQSAMARIITAAEPGPFTHVSVAIERD